MSHCRVPTAEQESGSSVSTPFSTTAHGSPSLDEPTDDADNNSIASTAFDSRPKPKIDPISKKEICEIGRDGKYLYNSHAREFGKIVQRRCVDPVDFHVSWKKVPYDTKEKWFDAFLVKYSHFGYTRDQAFSAFCNYGKEAYKNIIGKMKATWKKNGKKADWMSEALWEKWLAHWRDPKVKDRSAVASQNRRTGAGGVGSSTHAGGSVSFSQKLHIMESQNGGKDVNLLEAFVTYNAKKDENGKVLKNETGEVVFVHPRKKRVVNDYIAHVQPHTISEGEGGGGDNINDISNIPFDPNKWIESTGGIHKGHILGFGSKRALFGEVSIEQPSQSTRVMSNPLSHEEAQIVEEARRRETEALRQVQEMRTNMDAMMETQRMLLQSHKDMQEQLAQLSSQPNMNPSHPDGC